MKSKNTKNVLVATAIFSLFVTVTFLGCAEVYVTDEFEPTKIENGYEYFRLRATTNPWRPNPLENKEGERKRIDKLEWWLARNGYRNTEYEIISRRPILTGKDLALGTDIYNIYYEVRLKLQEKQTSAK